MPLPKTSENYPLSLVKDVIKKSIFGKEPVIVLSSVCPSYTTDSRGVPDYQGLSVGLSANTKKHFDYLSPEIKRMQNSGLDVVHFFLMADTEVDLLPFLKSLSISPEEFTFRCQASVEAIALDAVGTYGSDIYFKSGVPPAGRFLDFFGENEWFSEYERFKERLLSEREQEPYGRVAKSLEKDFDDRKILISKLLGDVSREEGINHIARQRAQYMAFAYLTRKLFDGRLIIANHRTPNFKWMNDRITREPNDVEQLANGNFLSKLPLIELDISTLPNN